MCNEGPSGRSISGGVAHLWPLVLAWKPLCDVREESEEVRSIQLDVYDLWEGDVGDGRWEGIVRVLK